MVLFKRMGKVTQGQNWGAEGNIDQPPYGWYPFLVGYLSWVAPPKAIIQNPGDPATDPLGLIKLGLALGIIGMVRKDPYQVDDHPSFHHGTSLKTDGPPALGATSGVTNHAGFSPAVARGDVLGNSLRVIAVTRDSRGNHNHFQGALLFVLEGTLSQVVCKGKPCLRAPP